MLNENNENYSEPRNLVDVAALAMNAMDENDEVDIWNGLISDSTGMENGAQLTPNIWYGATAAEPDVVLRAQKLRAESERAATASTCVS